MVDFVVDKRSAGPGTHALVVGVNDYPYHPAAGTMKWDSLTSPVPSAVAFADWLKRSHRNANAPLKTLQVLLSPGPFVADGEEFVVPTATFEHVRSAFGRFWDLCAQDQLNTGIFYFCGHGCEPRELCLLAEDAGADPGNPWDNFINFDLTYDAMRRNPAQSQIFILDACRDIPREMFKDEAQIGRPLRQPKTDGQAMRRDAPIYLAAGVQGARALGNANEPSVFTAGLIKCLDSFGASTRDGDDPWVVNTGSLREALGEFMGRQPVDGYDTTSGARSDFSLAQATRLHEIHGNCAALTNVRVAAPLDLAGTAVKLNGGGGAKTLPAGPGAWKSELIPGSYMLEADSQTHIATQVESVQPPVRNIVVPRNASAVRPR